jgi:hypothetical protein
MDFSGSLVTFAPLNQAAQVMRLMQGRAVQIDRRIITDQV